MTNNKIKMAQKNNNPESTVSEEMRNLLVAAQNKDLLGMIMAISEMKDEEFNEIAPGFTKNIEQVYSSREYRNNLAMQLSVMTQYDYEQEKASYDSVINNIQELDLSQEKKDFLTLLTKNAYVAILQYNEDPSEHIKVIYKKLTEDATVPTYAHSGDAGADLYASEDCQANAGDVTFVHTGIAMKIPKGYEGQIRPRSGMSAKTKIRIANAPGTIDSNYRGEVQIIVDNYGSAPYIIKKGDRVAQIVFNKVPTADFEEGEVDTEENNSRGEKGFGSSGTAEVNA